MIYHYICNKCKNMEDFNFPMGSAKSEIKCEKCGGVMVQNFRNKIRNIQTQVSEDYKALSEYHSVNYGDDDVMEKQLHCGGSLF